MDKNCTHSKHYGSGDMASCANPACAVWLVPDDERSEMVLDWECPKCGRASLLDTKETQVRCYSCLELFRVSELFPQTIEQMRALFAEPNRFTDAPPAAQTERTVQIESAGRGKKRGKR